MRVRRALWLWVAVLVAVGAGGLVGIPAERSGGDSEVVMTGGPPEAAVLGDVATAPSEPVARAVAGPLPPLATSTVPAPTTSVARRAAKAAVAASGGHENDGRPVETIVDTPPSLPLPDASGRFPCVVEIDLTIGSRLKVASAEAGNWGSSPLHVRNCRPRVGDVVSVRTGPPGLFGITQVAFGDGTLAGQATSSCNPVLMNSVEEEHRYTRAGRYLLEATTRYPCNPPGHELDPVVNRVEIEVTDPRPPEAPGAAPCSRLGPVKPGEPARQGVGTRSADTRLGAMDVRLMRCSVPAGQQSEVSLWWYEVQAVVDWGDGSPPEVIGGKGQQGASSVHTHTTRGLTVVTVWVLGADGTPGAPLTFTQQVT